MPLFKALPTGTIVGTTDVQTLTNKSLADPTTTGMLTGVNATFSGTIFATGTGSTITNGAGGTGNTASNIIINGGSGTGGGGAIGLQKNSVSKFTFGLESAVIGSGSSDDFIVRTPSTGDVLRVAQATGTTSFKGTTTNDSAAAGYVGEYLEVDVASGSAVALTTNTAKTVASLALTAGDWDVEASCFLLPAASTSVSRSQAGISSVTDSASFVSNSAHQIISSAAQVPGNVATSCRAGPVRISISGTTTYYLVAFSTFTVSTMSAYGHMSARRAR